MLSVRYFRELGMANIKILLVDDDEVALFNLERIDLRRELQCDQRIERSSSSEIHNLM